MLARLVPREIDYLWSRLARATRNLETLAPMWSRGSDPRVVRIVESAAYVFARVREKLEDDVPELSHPIVASALPEALRPFPSATIVQVGGAVTSRRDIAEHASLRLESRPIDGVGCVFQTAWPAVVAPVAIERTTLRTPEPGVQTLTLRLSTHGGAAFARVFPDPLRVFVRASNVFRSMDLVHALCTSRVAVHVRAFDARGGLLGTVELPPTALRWTALGGPFRLLPGRADRFASATALRAFHGFPEVFGFFDVLGLRDAVGRPFPRAEGIEVTAILGEPIGDFDVECALDCVPAVNVYDASAILPVRHLGSLGVLRAAGHRGAELFEISRARFRSARDSRMELDVRLWDSELASELWDDDLYLQLERRASIDRGPTEIQVSLLRPNGRDEAPIGDLHLDFLASDGLRTETLLRGDVGQRSDTAQTVNITRVTPPVAPDFNARLPWRMNAYARMPLAKFASAEALASYVELLDPRRQGAGGAADAASVGFLGATRRSGYRVLRDEVVHGDDVDLVLDEGAFGGRGATWLVGELVARAIAERAEALRFARVRWVRRDGTLIADYGRRTGERLPPPFG